MQWIVMNMTVDIQIVLFYGYVVSKYGLDIDTGTLVITRLVWYLVCAKK